MTFFIYLGLIVGSLGGGYLPTAWGGEMMSWEGFVLSMVGAVLGIFGGYHLGKLMGAE